MRSFMEPIDLLKDASDRVYKAVKGMAGTDEAGGDFGVGAGGDVSRNIDIVAEKAVIDLVKEKGFGCTILGEECGRIEIDGEPGGFLIMDAIDGSTNAVRGVPFFCCSLAYATENKLSTVKAGIVRDLSNGDSYWASSGQGAFLNDSPMHVYSDEPLYSIVGLNISGASAELVQRLQPLLESYNHLRHFGANALEMALFSKGLMDALVDLRGSIRIQDIAAGYLIVKEAGGIILDEELKPLDSDLEYTSRLSFVAASSRKVLDEVIKDII
ncbi:MAG: inositol-phosphate phosphatase [Cenarchaeum symbiont of Oopsacas minuta]|nr:inositol-phosphate phosphatase [Cenarchaeum symbiont of Oopsacas minuta]